MGPGGEWPPQSPGGATIEAGHLCGFRCREEAAVGRDKAPSLPVVLLLPPHNALAGAQQWSLDSTCFDLSDLVRTMKPIEAYHNSAVCDIEASLKISVWEAPLDSWFDSYRGRAVAVEGSERVSYVEAVCHILHGEGAGRYTSPGHPHSNTGVRPRGTDLLSPSAQGFSGRPSLVVLLRASRALQEEKRRCSLMDFCSSCHLIERDIAPLEPAHDQYQPKRPPPHPRGDSCTVVFSWSCLAALVPALEWF
ncbi:unnamed protein product [Arctogadus glacialis]